jgi:hypothetical protein
MRFRYFLSLNIPLNKREITEKTIYLSAYNEIFINTEEEYFDRNRLYGGLGYVVNKNLKLELAYMNQFLYEGSRDQINIVALLNF